MAEHSGKRRAPLSQAVAMVLGVVYLVLGIGGFFAGGKEILFFHTGVLLDIVRTAIGLLALVAARRGPSAQVIELAVFFGLAGLTVYGILSTASGEPADVRGLFDVHWADNILHGATAIAGLVFGLLPARRGSSAAPRV